MSRLSNAQDAKSVIEQVAIHTESQMLNQLGDLVKTGLLIWERGETFLVENPLVHGFEIRNTGIFRLRDQEAFDALKNENEELRARIAAIEKALG